MSLADQRWLRLGTLCLLYIAQGVPWGFTATVIPAYLADRGVSVETVGSVLAMTVLPYAFKWIWGPVIDMFTIPALGRRRPWILFAQSMMAATIFAMVIIPDLTEDIRLLAAMIFVHTIFNSMQDVAVDALAVDLLEEDERGRANGLMYACKYVGGFLGGFGVATIVDWYGFSVALYAQTGLLVAIMLLPFLVRERAQAAPRLPVAEAVPEVGRGLLEAFGVRSAILGLVVIVAFNFAYAVLIANANALYTRELGWTATQYARLSGGLALLVGFAGAVSAGFLSDLFGRRAVAAAGSLALALGWIAFSLLRAHWHDDVLVFGFAMVQAFALAVMTVALIAMCMDLSSPKVGASQFATYMAMQSVSTTLGYQLAGTANQLWTYEGLYLVGAAVQIAVTALLFAIDPGQVRRELPRPPGTPIDKRGLVVVILLFGGLAVMTVWSLIRTLG